MGVVTFDPFPHRRKYRNLATRGTLLTESSRSLTKSHGLDMEHWKVSILETLKTKNHKNIKFEIFIIRT